MKELVLKLRKTELLNLLNDYCVNECPVICKKREIISKDKCNIKGFVDYIFKEKE